LPSVVRYLPDAPAEVGHAAMAHQAKDPRNTIVSVKRFMGRGLRDVAHVEMMPYDFADAEGMVRLRTAQGMKSRWKSPPRSSRCCASAPRPAWAASSPAR